MENTIQAQIQEYAVDRSRRKNLSEDTISNIRAILLRVLTFGKGQFDLQVVEQYFDAMRKRGVQPSTVKTEMVTVKCFVSYIHKKKMIEENWAEGLELPKIHSRPEPLPSEYEAEQIIIAGTTPGDQDHAGHRVQKEHMRQACRFALRTGLRASEVVKLKGSDFYFGTGKFLVHSKGGNDDWMPIPLDMLEYLKSRAGEEQVFPVCMGTVNQNLKRGAKMIGLSPEVKADFHLLRKVFGTTLARNGMPMSMVSRLMRHSDISITQRFYVSYGLSETQEAMNMYHSLIRQGLPLEKVMEFYKIAIERLTKNDNRFTVVVEQEANEMIIRLRAR